MDGDSSSSSTAEILVRCQAITVSGLTIIKADRHSRVVRAKRTEAGQQSAGAVGICRSIVAIRGADAGEPGSLLGARLDSGDLVESSRAHGIRKL